MVRVVGAAGNHIGQHEGSDDDAKRDCNATRWVCGWQRVARIAEDGRIAIELLVDFSLGLLNALLAAIAFIVGNLLQRGLGALSWDFFTKHIPRPRIKGPGMGPAIAGTLIITGIAALISVPIGIFVGPMGMAFLQALLHMLHTELMALDDQQLPPKAVSPPPAA